MTVEKRLDIAHNIFADVDNLLLTKGKAYSSLNDSLANFYRNAERLGLTPFQIWAVYFNKHIDSINNAIQYNPSNPVDSSEGLEGRIRDAITYLTILECLLIEQKTEPTATWSHTDIPGGDEKIYRNTVPTIQRIH